MFADGPLCAAVLLEVNEPEFVAGPEAIECGDGVFMTWEFVVGYDLDQFYIV